MVKHWLWRWYTCHLTETSHHNTSSLVCLIYLLFEEGWCLDHWYIYIYIYIYVHFLYIKKCFSEYQPMMPINYSCQIRSTWGPSEIFAERTLLKKKSYLLIWICFFDSHFQVSIYDAFNGFLNLEYFELYKKNCFIKNH